MVLVKGVCHGGEPKGECTSARVLSFLHLLGPVVVAALTSHYAPDWLFCIVSPPGHSGGGHGHSKESRSVLRFGFLNCVIGSVPWFSCAELEV